LSIAGQIDWHAERTTRAMIGFGTWSEADLPGPSVRGAREPIQWDFRVNTLLGTPGGTRHQHPCDIMYAYINMVDGKSAAESEEEDDAHAEISTKNTIKVTEDQLSQE
jgi:hypothetical protein